MIAQATPIALSGTIVISVSIIGALALMAWLLKLDR
jgi:hypothetical protein